MNSIPTAHYKIKKILTFNNEELFNQSLLDDKKITIKNKNDSFVFRTQLQSDDIKTCIETQSNLNNLYSNVSSQQNNPNNGKNLLTPDSKSFLIYSSRQNKQTIQYKTLSNEDEENTRIIDYKYYTKLQDKNYILKEEKYNNNDSKLYWFAAYDKLIKTKKIFKILNYYNLAMPFDNKNKIKEKTAIINDYDIFFLNNFNKPFIYPNKDKKIFVKLYLLNINQINKIFSYINRMEYNSYINDLDFLNDKNSYKILKKNNPLNNYIYSTIYCLGSYMNINIYTFSTNYNNNNLYAKKNILPSSNKLAKIIKALILNFPDYNKKYFINYLIKPLNSVVRNYSEKEIIYFNKIIKEKKDEVNNLLISKNKNIYKENININKTINSIIKNTIASIPTNSSILICSSNNENSNSNYLLNKLKNSFNCFNSSSDNKSNSINQISNNISDISKISNINPKNNNNENSNIFSLFNPNTIMTHKNGKENEKENEKIKDNIIEKVKEKSKQNNNDQNKLQNFIQKRINFKKKNYNYYDNYNNLNSYKSIFEDSLTDNKHYKKINSMENIDKQKKKNDVFSSQNYCNKIIYKKKTYSSFDNKKCNTENIFRPKNKKYLIPKNFLKKIDRKKIITNNNTINNNNGRKTKYFKIKERKYFKTLNDENMNISIRKKIFSNNKKTIKTDCYFSKSKDKDKYVKLNKNISNVFF